MARKRGRGMAACWYGIARTAAIDRAAAWAEIDDGGSASRFWLVQSGHVDLDLHVPGQGRMKIETIGMGELLGWSWLFPPYKWAFGAVAASPATRSGTSASCTPRAAATRSRCAAAPSWTYR